MSHYAILCPAATGHLNPMCSLGRALMRRGHRVTLFQMPDRASAAEAAGLGFRAVGTTEFPPGELDRLYERLGQLSGLAALRFTVEFVRRATEVILRDVPEALRSEKVDAVLVDQITAGGTTAAEVVGLPHVTVCNALTFHEEPNVPPPTSGWPYSVSTWARLRNRCGHKLFGALIRPLMSQVNSARRAHGLPPYRSRAEADSRLVTVSQQVPEFDFPRRELPATFHYAGPFSDPTARAPVAFPWERLDGRPVVYASMGTLQNRLPRVFSTIAEACAGLDVQLVLSLGGSADPEAFGNLAGDPIVVRYAPQLELLDRARLLVTHAGLNSTLEALSRGVPMVGIPITNDQPAVGSRLAWSGAGRVVTLRRLNVERLRTAIRDVLDTPSYRTHAERLRDAIRRAGGAPRAAEIVERATGGISS